MYEYGFYKNINNNIVFAQNQVVNINYELNISDIDDKYIPVDGWYVFNTKQEAYDYFGLDIPIIKSEEEIQKEAEEEIQKAAEEMFKNLNIGVSMGRSRNNIDRLRIDSQPLLLSGENIKTVNNQSILGSGNIDIVRSPLIDS